MEMRLNEYEIENIMQMSIHLQENAFFSFHKIFRLVESSSTK